MFIIFYDSIVKGIFIERPNRFIAYCKIEGEVHKVHVKNTGRCKELLVEGVTVYLQHHNNPNRKTAYSLIAVEKGDRLINMDSQVPNKVAYDAVKDGHLHLPGIEEPILLIKPEKTYQHSRFDLYIETATKKAFMEVKGVTLEEDGIVKFPDAKTERGTKHILELIDAKEEGYLSYLLFVIQMDLVDYFTPNIKRDPAFANALREAKEKGVILLAYTSVVTQDSITLKDEIPILL